MKSTLFKQTHRSKPLVIGLGFAITLSTAGFQEYALADIFHYSNILVGDRAIGLGGAYAGISDDASGVYYNPAGLSFALANDISGSANAFYTKSVTFEKTIGDDSFIENSSGPLAPFFGSLIKLDNLMERLTFAFAIYSTDVELKDQNDFIRNESGLNGLPVDLIRFHRSINQNATTSYFGAALSYRFASNMAFGLSTNLVRIRELTQVFQDVQLGTSTVVQFESKNIRQALAVDALQFNLGFQAAFGSFSVGLTYKPSLLLSESFVNDIDGTVIAATTGDLGAISSSGSTISSTTGRVSSLSVSITDPEQAVNVTRTIDDSNNEGNKDSPFVKLADEIRLGAAKAFTDSVSKMLNM